MSNLTYTKQVSDQGLLQFKLVDNGDGTYSEYVSTSGGGGGGGAVTIADGADVTEGAIADAIVAAGAAGTVSAKLRRLTNDMSAAVTALQAALPAGSNVIGGVTVAQLPASLGPQAPSASTGITFSNDVSLIGTTYTAINTDLLSGSVSGWYDATSYHSASFQIIGSAGISAGAIFFEQTNDTTNASAGNIWPVEELTTLTPTPNIAAITIAASTTRMFGAAITARYVRVRISTGFTGGTVQCSAMFSQLPYNRMVQTIAQATAANLAVTAATVTTVTTVSTLTGGATAEDSATSSNPIIVGGIARTALPASTVIAGDAVRLTFSTSGQAVIKPFAVRDLDFFVNTTISTNTQTAIRAAQAAGIRQNITAITYQNTNATATTVTIQDASATLIQFSAAASMANPITLTFPTPLFGTAATALNYTAGTTGASVLLNVTGFNSY